MSKVRIFNCDNGMIYYQDYAVPGYLYIQPGGMLQVNINDGSTNLLKSVSSAAASIWTEGSQSYYSGDRDIVYSVWSGSGFQTSFKSQAWENFGKGWTLGLSVLALVLVIWMVKKLFHVGGES
jgi:hypothetical protein